MFAASSVLSSGSPPSPAIGVLYLASMVSQGIRNMNVVESNCQRLLPSGIWGCVQGQRERVPPSAPSSRACGHVCRRRAISSPHLRSKKDTMNILFICGGAFPEKLSCGIEERGIMATQMKEFDEGFNRFESVHSMKPCRCACCGCCRSVGPWRISSGRYLDARGHRSAPGRVAAGCRHRKGDLVVF